MSRMAATVFNRLTLIVACLSNALPTLAQESARQYLSGRGTDDAVAWDFSVSAGDNSGRWSTLPVPSCWDMQGFGKLSYQAKGLAEQGRYRHRFTVPADWAGRTVWLVFDGSMTDTQAWVNGQSAGPTHQGAYYRFKYDVTRLVRPGGQNLLEVTVDKESANPSVNNAERRGDYWNYGGIFRPVYLEATPVQHVDRLAIAAAANGAFAVDVYAVGVTSADRVRAQIVDAAATLGRRSRSSPLWCWNHHLRRGRRNGVRPGRRRFDARVRAASSWRSTAWWCASSAAPRPGRSQR